MEVNLMTFKPNDYNEIDLLNDSYLNTSKRTQSWLKNLGQSLLVKRYSQRLMKSASKYSIMKTMVARLHQLIMF